MTKKKATDEPQIVSLDTKQDESFISTGISEIDQLVGGFAKMQQENPERLQQIAREASKKRWQSNSNSNTKT